MLSEVRSKFFFSCKCYIYTPSIITDGAGGINHLPNFKLSIFVDILQVLKFEFQWFRILEILNFHPWLFF